MEAKGLLTFQSHALHPSRSNMHTHVHTLITTLRELSIANPSACFQRRPENPEKTQATLKKKTKQYRQYVKVRIDPEAAATWYITVLPSIRFHLYEVYIKMNSD